jgi:hypothetical protein
LQFAAIHTHRAIVPLKEEVSGHKKKHGHGNHCDALRDQIADKGNCKIYVLGTSLMAALK